MLTDPKLHSQIGQLWDKLWTGGLSNPMDAIEQLSYLIFLKNAEFKINKPSLLIEACKLIDQMQFRPRTRTCRATCTSTS